eukprot:CAMPEP_0116988814 /NCGR_PEP_ID=MMETSP0467-20121206/64405_1 /TAXON_ID=283647 /ORGANISM="Mesodinium pulex, Strain SPMC105" /LENGTH=57 /DNA_ID=CAMNT_0004685055 /DNA_START=139 /DNA_END=312 /DNA_ORIENTATION=-
MNYLKLSLVYALRTKMHVSKYVLWTAFAVASVPQVEQLIVHAAVASLPEPVQALLAR